MADDMPYWPNYDFPAVRESEDEEGEEPPSRGYRLLSFLDDIAPAVGIAWNVLIELGQIIVGAFIGALLAISLSNLSGAEQIMPSHISGTVLSLLALYFIVVYFARLAGWIGSDFWEDLSDRYGL